jgi:hypothetical protein
MKKNIIAFGLLYVLFAFFACGELVLDFESGEYYDISEEEAKAKKETEERKRLEDENNKEYQIRKRNYNPMTLPEDEMTKEEWKEEVKNNPWQKWVFKKGIVTNDFVNTSSNVVVITFLDYEGATQNGVSDIKTIREKYKLCCVLHPGDKYVETHDGKNGFRFARYLQVHNYCKQAKLYCGLKYMDIRDFDSDGIGNWEEIKGVNLKLKINNKAKEKLIFTNPGNVDSDNDTIKDGDEVYGKNGFITDPTDPDTDGDGIPDNEDKNPLVSCISNNPQNMPIEWAEYWSKGDSALLKKLIPVNGDCDNDGFTNAEEKMMETDPTVPNKEKMIVFPKHLVLNNIGDDQYEGEFNVLINTNVMTEISLNTGSWYDTTRKHPGIKYISSTPLHKNIFKWKSLYSESVRDSKSYFKFAVVQPMTVHKFKIIYKKEGWFEDLDTRIMCYNADNSRDNFNLISEINLIFKTEFEKYYPPEKTPEVPKIIKPSPDFYFFSNEQIACEWTDTNVHYPWSTYFLVSYMQINNVFLGKNFKYQDNYNGRYNLSDRWNNFASYKDNSDDEFLALAFGVNIKHEQKICLLGEHIPVFRTRRLTEDSSFVFKPDTMRNIRLQAKYGKENYQKRLIEEKVE